MRRIAAVLVISTVALTGCGVDLTEFLPDSSGNESAPPTITITSDVVITESSESPEPETDTPDPAPAPAPAQAPTATVVQEVEEPYVVECLDGTPGPARWSDGSTSYSQWCFDQRGGAAVLENEANAGLPATPAPAPEPRQPSPWVQGQIDWANCLEAGNSEQYCRDTLN